MLNILVDRIVWTYEMYGLISCKQNHIDGDFKYEKIITSTEINNDKIENKKQNLRKEILSIIEQVKNAFTYRWVNSSLDKISSLILKKEW